MKIIVVSVCLLLVIGCQKRAPLTAVVWEKGSDPIPTVPSEFRSSSVSIRTKFGSVERAVQKVDGAEVDTSFLQIVKDKKNEPVFLKMQYLDKKSDKLTKKVSELALSREAFLVKAKKHFPELSQASYLSPVKLVVVNKTVSPDVLYQVDAIAKDGTSVQRWLISPKLRVVKKTQVSSFYDGQGMAFPNGPELSQLEEVPLLNLVGDGSLNSRKVKVLTQSGQPAISQQHSFYFKPDDLRFDQVQVFYYANKMIQTFKTRLGVELPFDLELKTHIGYPEKKTVMFYYDHRIHLGQGDEVSYKDILKDPTIVMHETAHAFVDALSGLPQGALNEAFADFFTTTFLNQPTLGEVSYVTGPYTRTVDQHISFQQKKGNVYGDSQIVSSLLWEIRKSIGVEATEGLALKALMRLGPTGDLDQVGGVLRALVQSDLKPADQEKVLKILQLRHFPLGENE
jgi:Zn-dependent metalloprotease